MEALERVLSKLYRGRRLLGPEDGVAQAGKSGLCLRHGDAGTPPPPDDQVFECREGKRPVLRR